MSDFCYVYDPAGNILSKRVHGKTTRFPYDAANQIASRINPDGSVVRYQYDAVGRLLNAVGYENRTT